MKKIFALLLLMIIALFSGCSEKILPAKNEISPVELTEDQREILTLISDSTNESAQEILIFDYKTADPYKNVKFWIEAYEYGELVKTINIWDSFSDELLPLDSRASIEPGKDIVLYDSIFAKDSISTRELQLYVTEPAEQLAPYPYAQLIKCRFE